MQHLKAAFGLPLTDTELETFHTIAGSRTPPTQRVKHLFAIVGRRSGKSRMAALVAVYLATCVEHKGKLAKGELVTCSA